MAISSSGGASGLAGGASASGSGASVRRRPKPELLLHRDLDQARRFAIHNLEPSYLLELTSSAFAPTTSIKTAASCRATRRGKWRRIHTMIMPPTPLEVARPPVAR